MKVLIVYPAFNIYGGGEVLVVRLCNYLTSQGVENSILTTNMIDEIAGDLKDTKIHIEKNKFKSDRLVKHGELLALKKGIKKYHKNFDIINVHNYPAEIAAKFCTPPVVWMCNEPELYLTISDERFAAKPWPIRKFFEIHFNNEIKIVKKFISKAVVSDEYNAKRFEKIYNVRPDIVHYGIDYDYFSNNKKSNKTKKVPQTATGRFTVLHVGMLTPLKNQYESLAAVNKIKDKIPDIQIIFAGGGSKGNYRQILDEYIKSNSLGNNVVFRGHIPRSELKELFYSSDVMLHPIKPQGGWLSPFEMLSAGKPIIVSKEMTASGLIERENLGIVTDNFSKAIYDVYQNKKKYLELALKGQRFVKDNLSWDNYGKRMLDIFKGLTS